MTKLAIVSGGSRGLGAALCDAFLGQGFELIELSRAAPRSQSVRVDFAEPEAACTALRTAITSMLERIGAASIDEVVVVSNAAMLEPIGPTPRQATGAIARNLEVNLVGAITFVAAAVDALQAVRARKLVIVIGSGAASNPHAGLSLYGAAKAGLEQYVRTLALEQSTEPCPFIAVTVDPGALDTDMQLALRSASPRDFPHAADFAARHERGALRSAGDAAAAILRLASDATLQSGQRYRP
jgi:benzil reductase ((S)-benzoin forming)